jgi:hypothetical protein
MVDRMWAGLRRIILVAIVVLGMLMHSGQATMADNTDTTPTATPNSTQGSDPGGHGG